MAVKRPGRLEDMDRILVKRQSETLLEYLLEKEKTRIGRAPGNDIAFSGEMNVSESHAEVLKGPAGYSIADLDSPGGTFVNGERIKEIELRDGDEISIGDYTLLCLSRAAEENVQDPPAAEAASADGGAPPADAPPGPAGQAGSAWDGESTVILQRKAEMPGPEDISPAPEPAATEPGAPDLAVSDPAVLEPAAPDPATPAGDTEESITPPPLIDEDIPAAVPAVPAQEAENRFAVTSILKVPRKNKDAPGAVPASPDLEEGVIEIAVPETPFWSKNRTKAAVLAGAAVCSIAVLAVLRSADFRALLLPGSRISFNVVPDDAQVYVNGVAMPKPGSGVLRNVPAGVFSVRVSHPSYPEARTIDIETGLFKRRAKIESDPGGIFTR